MLERGAYLALWKAEDARWHYGRSAPNYDPEAWVWYSVVGDIPGLAADADTPELLAAKASAMMPDLLEIHADDIVDKARLHSVRIIAHHEADFAVAP